LKGRNTDLFIRNHYKQTGDSEHDFPDSFLLSDMWGSNWPVYTSAHHPWEGPSGVAKRYRLTPILPQWFWNPKPRRITVSFLSVRVSLCECWWYWYRRKEKDEGKRIGEKRCPPGRERSGEFDKSRRVRIFVRQFFTSAERPRTRGTRFEHFSSSRTERNRPREIRSHVLCICRCIQSREKSLVIFLNWRFDVDNAIGWSCFVARGPMTRFAWFTDI